MLSNVYNQLYTQLPARRSSGRRMNNPTELREQYSRMVQRNALSPIYLLRPNSDRKNFLLNMKEEVSALSATMDRLDPAASDLYTTYRAVSDHSGLAAPAVLSDPADPSEVFELQIHTLALPQKNEGVPVNPRSHALRAGLYRFQADVKGSLYEFQFRISEGSNNESILTKLADFLGKTGIGIKASVETADDSRIRMTIESKDTGVHKPLIFTLEDMEYPDGGRGLVEYLGLNDTVQYPSNASYSINGVETGSDRNDIFLNNNMKVSLLESSGETIRLGYRVETEQIRDTAGRFMEQYNQLLKTGQDALNNNSASSAVVRNLSSLLSRHTMTLAACGFHFEEQQLAVDEEKLNQAAGDGTLSELFSSSSPFRAELKNELSRMYLDPVRYTDKVVVSYPDTSRQRFLSPYAVSLYSGMFFNESL